jgi:hypothetical protein
MNYNYDLSILVPGIRNENWETLVQQVKDLGCKRYTFEMIFCGPYALPASLQSPTNIKCIKDFGSPSRALQIASLLAEGRFMTWLSDDGHVAADSIDLAMDLLLSHNPDKDIIGMRYCEGPGHSGSELSPSYWVAGTHDDLRAPGVDPNWKTSGVLLISMKRFKELGGINTSYDHVNMNIHDLAFRVQRDGGNIYLSPTQVMNCDFELNRTVQNSPVIAAFFENDRALFWEAYKEKNANSIVIDFDNWRNMPPVWSRRKY